MRRNYIKKSVAIFLSVIFTTICCSCMKEENTESSKNEDAQDKNVQIDYSEYVGDWVCEDASMEITSSNPEILSVFFSFSNEDGTRIASIEQSILVSAIENNTVTDAFTDSWGSSGVSVMTFEKDSITYELKNVVYGDGLWSVSEGVYNFVRDDSPEEEWETENPYENTPMYDTSKSSGILASLGMTEEEFRASCQPLPFLCNLKKDYTTTRDLREYPSQYINQHYRIYGTIDFSGMVVGSKSTSMDGYTTYHYFPEYSWEENLILFDCRDDIYAPTISDGDYIEPYMIFTGVQTINGIDYVCFKMVAVDKH